MKNIKLKINNRYIFNTSTYESVPQECTLCEISPSGKYYKFHTDNKGFIWVDRDKVELLENLGPVEVPQPNPAYEKAPYRVYMPIADRPFEPFSFGSQPNPVLPEEILKPKNPEPQCEPPKKEFEYSFIVDITDSYVTYRYLLPSNGSNGIADVAEACAKTIGCGRMSSGVRVT